MTQRLPANSRMLIDHCLRLIFQIQRPGITENLKVSRGSKFQTQLAMSRTMAFHWIKSLTVQKEKVRIRSRSNLRVRIAKMSRRCMKSSWEILLITKLQMIKARNPKCMMEVTVQAVSCNSMMEVVISSLNKQH